MMVSSRKWILCVPLALVVGVNGFADPPAPCAPCGIVQTSYSEVGGNCGFSCPHHHCPPAYKHCVEGPPHLRFKCGCPLPVCPPDCNTPNWGYYQPCWNPWPWPPDWSHCPVPPPASQVIPGNEIILPIAPRGQPQQELPPPRKM
jgi:hypothetical protein